MTFGIDTDGNYGYIKAGADTVTPFKTIQVFDDFPLESGQLYGTITINAGGTLSTTGTLKIADFHPYFRMNNAIYLSHTTPFKNKNKISITWKYTPHYTSVASQSVMTFQVGIATAKTGETFVSGMSRIISYNPYYDLSKSYSETNTYDLSSLNGEYYILLKMIATGTQFYSEQWCSLEVTNVVFSN